MPRRRPGAGRDPLRHGLALGLGIELRQQQVVQAVGADALDRRRLVDQPLLDHLDGDPDRRGPGPLAGAGLEHVQRAVLDGELDVLHLLVVRLELLADARCSCS